MKSKKLWRIPQMWLDQRAVILASGPSMSREVVEKVQRAMAFRVITVNTTYRLAPWADLIYAADATWWKIHWDDVQKCHGLKVSCSDVPHDEVLQIEISGKEGFDPDPSRVKSGGNSGYQAIQIAVHAGVRQILLCGFDMHGGHWHGRHPNPLRDHGDGLYVRWLERFPSLAAELGKRGIEVVNCTPGSALKVWPYVPLEEALDAREVA